MYRLQIVLISSYPRLHIEIFSCSVRFNLIPLSFFLATRMKREWFPFSLSQTVPSPLRQGQGPLKSPCPSVSGSAPPLTLLMPRGRTGSSWLKSSTLIGMIYSTLKPTFHSHYLYAVIYLLLSLLCVPRAQIRESAGIFCSGVIAE